MLAVFERGELSVTSFVFNPDVGMPDDAVDPSVRLLVIDVKPLLTDVLAIVRVT